MTLIKWLVVGLALIIPHFTLSRATIPHPEGNVYMLHFGLRWMGFSFLVSLSFTDNRSLIRNRVQEIG